MKINVDFEASILQPLLVRCQQEGCRLDDVVNAWMRRALRQTRTVLPTQESHRPKVLEMPRR